MFNLLKWLGLFFGLSKIIPLACPPNIPQHTQNNVLKFSFNHNDNVSPQTWTLLPNTFGIGRFSHTVTTIDTTDDSSSANTPSTGIRRVESDLTFSFYPQDPVQRPTEYAAQVAFETGHKAAPTAPCWFWIPPSDVIATGSLACATITSWEDTSDQEGVRVINITIKPRWTPDEDVAEPVTIP